MKIVIDAAPLNSGHKTRGIGQYIRCLTAALEKIQSQHQIILTSKINSISNVDLIHYPYFDLFHSRLPFYKSVPGEVITIHDLIPLKLLSYFRPGFRSGINLDYQKWKVKRMDAIITDSECSRQDVISLLGISPDKVHVVYLGVDERFQPKGEKLKKLIKDKYRLPTEFILYVGDINPNKNLRCLIEVVGDLKNIPLVIVSQALKDKSAPEAKKLYSLIDKLNIGSQITILSDLAMDSINELAAIYSSAVLYVQPSLYEGFGLPVLEAMACGTPAVSANTSSLPEVVGEAGLLVEPTRHGLASGIKKMLSDENIRKKYSGLGFERIKLFTLENTARQTLKIYEKVYASYNNRAVSSCFSVG